MTIDDYRIKLGWSKRRMAREAGIDVSTLSDAIAGKRIYKAKAGLIANAIGRGLSQEITIRDPDGLNLID